MVSVMLGQGAGLGSSAKSLLENGQKLQLTLPQNIWKQWADELYDAGEIADACHLLNRVPHARIGALCQRRFPKLKSNPPPL